MTPVFGHGHLRLYLLSLLDESPMHGYELIQALGDRFGGTYIPSAGTIYPRLAKDYGVLFYPFMLDGVAMNPKLNQADGMHPNPAGVKIIVARILPYVKKMLAQVPQSGQAPQPKKRG